MSATIPRAIVAEALFADEASLPPGDLPLNRFAARFLAFLRETNASDAPGAHPEFWTYSLFDELTAEHPALCLAAIRASLAAAETPDQIALIGAGPLEDLLRTHGAEMIDAVETLATEAPRFRYALTGVWPPEAGAPLLWARVRRLAETGPQLDAGDPLPPADGLV